MNSRDQYGLSHVGTVSDYALFSEWQDSQKNEDWLHKKAKQVMNCVLEILIPEQEGEQELPCIHAVTNPVPDKINKCEKKFQMKH